MNKIVPNENGWADLNIRWHHNCYIVNIEIYINNECVNCILREILIKDSSIRWADDDFGTNPGLYYKELQLASEVFVKRFINMKAFL